MFPWLEVTTNYIAQKNLVYFHEPSFSFPQTTFFKMFFYTYKKKKTLVNILFNGNQMNILSWGRYLPKGLYKLYCVTCLVKIINKPYI